MADDDKKNKERLSCVINFDDDEIILEHQVCHMSIPKWPSPLLYHRDKKSVSNQQKKNPVPRRRSGIQDTDMPCQKLDPKSVVLIFY